MTRYRRAPRVIWRPVGDETVLCSLDDGVYYALNPTGATAWQLLSDGASEGAVVNALTQSFEVSEEQARADLDTLIADLLDRALLERIPNAAP